MKDRKNKGKDPQSQNSRRQFIGDLGKTAAGAAAVLTLGASPFVDTSSSAQAAPAGGEAPGRMNDCFTYRKNAAIAMRVNVGAQADNGDSTRFSDFSGNFSKALPHDSLGIPNAAAYLSLRNAFATGDHLDFNDVIVGTPGGGSNSKLNGPQVALAFDLEGLDSHATVIPPAPSVASAQTAAEMVEHYWGALLRDVPFSEYGSNALVSDAVADLNGMSFVNGTKNVEMPRTVTRKNLFRGHLTPSDGSTSGPYISQFMCQPTSLGAHPLAQKYRTFASVPQNEFMTSVGEFQLVQNGGESGRQITMDPTARYIRCGRDLAAYTNVDVLYQAYFTAFLVLSDIGAPANPGNPYNTSLTQKGFATLGGPDAAAMLGEVATRALKASWFHKWIKDMRLRPEEYGALVHARKTNTAPMPQAASALHADVLNSKAVDQIHSLYGGYLLPQAFPEGSPTHPCYPTGHGAVGGACVTVLKFFFDGNAHLRPLLINAGREVYEANADGMSLNTYTGIDSNSLDVNGELTKLAFNVTLGHGIHSGIHFRSSSYWSMLLGEQVALAFLQERARSYNEKFSITIERFDGTLATITNQ
jgi:hypothetical protein